MAAPDLDATTAPSRWSLPPETHPARHAPIAAQLSGKCPRPSLCPPASPPHPPHSIIPSPWKWTTYRWYFCRGSVKYSFYWGYRTLWSSLWGVKLPLWHLSWDPVIRWTTWLAGKRKNRFVGQVQSRCPRCFSRFNGLLAGVLTELSVDFTDW